MVEVRIVEYLAENFLGQEVLDQHFAHVRRRDGRIDRLLRVLEELDRRLLEVRILGFGIFDGFPKRA